MIKNSLLEGTRWTQNFCVEPLFHCSHKLTATTFSHLPFSIDDVTYVYIQTALCWQNTVYIMFRRAKHRIRHVSPSDRSHMYMVRLHVLSSWQPKHKGFARRYARESCYGYWVTSEVTSSFDWRQTQWLAYSHFLILKYSDYRDSYD